MAGVLTATHWGTYRVETHDGRVAKISPFELDPDPSAIGQSLVGVLDHPCRVTHPMVRKGWLEKGPVGTGATRGSDVFVPLSWPAAVELVSRGWLRIRLWLNG
jgi:biotin/methionine sulfoxide reductase